MQITLGPQYNVGECFFPFFVSLEMSLFPSIFSAFSLYGECVVRASLPDGV